MIIEASVLGAQIGDKILDSKKNIIGTVVREDTSGNYNLLYVDFGGKIRRICPMDDAQIEGRYNLIKEVNEP